MLFPREPHRPRRPGIELDRDDDGLPVVLCDRPARCGDRLAAVPACCPTARACRCSASTPAAAHTPHLRGHRRRSAAPGGPRLVDEVRLPRRSRSRRPGPARATCVDKAAGLGVLTEVEALPGGALRLRHTLTNRGAGRLRARGPRGGAAGGRPPRRDARLHRTARARAHPAAACGHRRPVAARDPRRPARPRVGHHGRARHAGLLHDARRGAGRARRLERQLGAPRRARRRPAAPRSAAASCCCPARYGWRRARATRRRGSTSPPPTTASTGSPPRGTPTSAALPSHPERQPVVLNVWEAVFFDHDLDAADARIADRAARVGVERFVLDDGWFHGPPRRHRRARRLVGRPGRLARGPARRWSTTSAGSAWSSGCGSSRRWSTPTPTSTASTRTGSSPPATGLPCSIATSWCSTCPGAEVRDHVFAQISAVLSAYPIDCVKWDHNRDLLEAGSGVAGRRAGGAPADDWLLRAARRAARGPSRDRLGVVRLGRRPGRPRRPRAGAAGLDLRHDRRPGPAADPALDHPAASPRSTSARTSRPPPRTPPAGR